MKRERPLKVYCWAGSHPDAPGRHHEVRFYIAAHSKDEARHLSGWRSISASKMATIDHGDGFLAARQWPGILIWEPQWKRTEPCPTCGGSGRLELSREFRAAFEEGSRPLEGQ